MLHAFPHALRPCIAVADGLDTATRAYVARVETAICIVTRHRRGAIQVDGLCLRADFTCQDAAVAAKALLLHAGLILQSSASVCRHGKLWSVVGIKAHALTRVAPPAIQPPTGEDGEVRS